MSKFRNTKNSVLVAAVCAASLAMSAADRQLEYRILATSKTSTMEKELNAAGAAGYRFSKAMGGKSANGGQEVIVAMMRDAGASAEGVRKYRLLATNRTSTMQKELQEAGAQGYVLLGLAVGKTEIGGDEIVTILRRDD